MALALFLFIAFSERHRGGRTALAAEGTALVPSLRRDAVTAIELNPAGQPPVRLRKPAVFWELESPLRYPAQSAAAEQWLQLLENARWAVRLGPDELENVNPSEFGLEPSRLRVTLRQGESTVELRFGNNLALGKQCYLRVGDKPDIFVTDAALLEALPQTAEAWRDRSLLSFTSIVQSNRFTFDYRIEVRPEASGYTLQPDPGTGRWRIQKPTAARGDRSKIEQLVRMIALWRIEEFVTDDPAADLLAFGLQSPEQELVIGRGTNDLLAVQFGASPTNRRDLVYARQWPGSNVVLTARTNLEVLRLPYTVWRERLLLSINTNQVQEIVGESSYAYRVRQQADGSWQIVEPEKLPVDRELVAEFFSLMNSAEAAGFEKDVVTDFGEYGLAAPARRFSFLTLTNGAYTNLLPSISFGTNGMDLAFARRSDEEAVYSIPPGIFHSLPVAHWQWRDRLIWSFRTNEVHRVRLAHDGLNREVVRDAEGRWSLAPGSTGVLELSFDEAVFQMSTLRANRWMGRGLDARGLFGFSTNGLRVTFEWARGGVNHTNTVEFGGVNLRGEPFAATRLDDGQEWYFEFPAAVYYEYVRRNLLIPGAR